MDDRDVGVEVELEERGDLEKVRSAPRFSTRWSTARASRARSAHAGVSGSARRTPVSPACASMATGRRRVVRTGRGRRPRRTSAEACTCRSSGSARRTRLPRGRRRDVLLSARLRGARRPASGYPHWPGVPPPPHVCGGVQVPQLGISLPQPSPAGPQLMFWSWQLFGVQLPPGGAPHWPGTPPPPHVWGGVHVPQLAMRFPQPSPAGPHECSGPGR